MAEKKEGGIRRRLNLNHRGRGSQSIIYLVKFLRMFIYQSDWKVLPMSALVVGLVGLVIRRRFCVDMEGTLTGSFALVCMCIWNGCFNSIQVVCRERDVIKREHRAGLHITSYVFAHMLCQALLCLAQTAITLYVLRTIGVRFPKEGMVTNLFLIDFGISIFLITYAADMLSLWISSLSRSTTTAMTVMPFVLIFQLVFSGGMLSLPDWAMPFTNYTVSSPGLKLIAAQADINSKPFVTISNMLSQMQNEEIVETVTAGEVIDRLQDTNISGIAKLRALELQDGVTAGDIIDYMAEDPRVKENRDKSYTVHTTVGELMELVGKKKVENWMSTGASSASYRAEYEYDPYNVGEYWIKLFGFVLLFAALAVVTLEFIDKDKR